jgi:hypothetical protein
MSFSIQIFPDEVTPIYGVKSEDGFEITTQSLIQPEEIRKIQSILSAFVDASIAEKNFNEKQEKFELYVSWLPKEEWEDKAEYALYKQSLSRLEETKEKLSEVKKKYQVISITPY